MLNSTTKVCLLASILTLGSYVYIKKKQRQRRFKVREINQNRKKFGFYNATFLQMKTKDPKQFFKYTRMNKETFDKFVQLVAPKIKKKKLPDSVSAEERIAVTLHFLSQGTSMQTIAWTYQLGLTTVHQIIHETSQIIWEVLSPIYLKAPSTLEEWYRIADGFAHKWNFPHCIGALDGKHIHIQAPAGSGSQYFNYKGTFSIVLLACCDSSYLFTMIDVGAYGSQSDGGIFRESLFGRALEENHLHVPNPTWIGGTDTVVPFVIVADSAFPLKNYIMRPYPGKHLTMKQRIFNYRLSRARRIIENAFGILVARWRILRTTIVAKVENIDNIVKAVVCLHNYLKQENSSDYCPPGYVDSSERNNGQWRNEIEPLLSVGRLAANNANQRVLQIRELFSNYFMSPEGKVPWQEARVREGIAFSLID